MKMIGKAKVINSDQYTRKDGTIGYRCVALTDDNQPVVFYRPEADEPKVNDIYVMILAYDNKLSAVVRYQKNEG